MAWTTPPTFSDGAILSAAQLNILSADLEYLYALLQAPQPASSTLYANRDLNSTNNSWRIRYKNRYLHYRATVAAGTVNNFAIVVNGTTYTLDSTARTSGYVYSSYIDVNAQGLTVGTIYNVYFTTALATQNISAILIQDLIMAEGTSL